MSHVLTSTFPARPEAEYDEIQRKAHEVARSHFTGHPYRMSVEVEDVRSISGKLLRRDVTVTAEKR